jgi:hypothetical protein
MTYIRKGGGLAETNKLCQGQGCTRSSIAIVIEHPHSEEETEYFCLNCAGKRLGDDLEMLGLAVAVLITRGEGIVL